MPAEKVGGMAVPYCASSTKCGPPCTTNSPVPAQRLVGSGRLAGIIPLRQALPLVERLPPVDLTPGEAAALVAALVAIGPYTSATARTALDKLLTALVE